MRLGLFKPVPSPDDQRLQRIQDNVKQAVETLAADDDVLSVPVTAMTVSGQIPAGKSVVVFRGNAGQRLTLPQSKSQGDNVSAQLIILNTSANSVEVVPTAGDTLNGLLTATLAAGGIMSLVSDGLGAGLG